MREEVLHLVWKFGLLNHFDCYSTNGEKVQVISVGTHNDQNAGPDFSTAKIRVGETLWVGHVEIHNKTSDWYSHLHHFDKAYQNVVLHVVYEDDCGDVEGTKQFPILELKKCVDPQVWERILKIEKSKKIMPCSGWLSTINALDWISWQDRLLVERFERKANEVEVMLQLNNKNWESVSFQLLAKSLGGTVNQEPFLILTRLLPLEVLKKHRNDILVIESIMFGVAGMLNDHFSDLYPKSLKSEYLFYKQKFRLEEMECFWWKWLRLRPSSFPTIQISMLASLICNVSRLENVFEIKTFEAFKKMMQANTSLTSYWENHYIFDIASKEKPKNWGDDLLRRIFINAIIPYQIARARVMGTFSAEIILDNLIELKPENNKITRMWKALGLKVNSAYESQALIQLNKEYCSQKKCLNCNIGLKVLKQSTNDKIDS